MAVTFDPVNHRYAKEDGTPLISVTQALREGGLSDENAAQYYTEASRDRGTAIHAALEAWHLGAACNLKVEYLPYWLQIERFLTDGGFESESAEIVVHDERVGYAGTYDILGHLKRFNDSGYDLIDIKTGSVPKTVGIQTMGYRRCLPMASVRRWALQVTPTRYKLIGLNVNDTTGRIDVLQDRRDEQLFLAALTIAQFKRSHSGIPVYAEV